MVRVLALAASCRAKPLEALRAAIVCGCAAALIMARQALPF